MKAGKWIGGILGFIAYGPLGALSGFIFGSVMDSLSDTENINKQETTQDAYDEGQRNSLLFSLLVLASYIIRSDGKVMHSEMEYVRNFLRQNFGESAVRQGEQILLTLFEKQKQMDKNSPSAYSNTIRECCVQISVCMPYEQRLQLLSFLVSIAKADGRVVKEEIEAVRYIAQAMGLSQEDINSMLNLGGSSLQEAYKVLGLDESATDEQVRKAYKAMALKHHPDKVASLGEDIRLAAEQKFKEIGQARDIIFKARGMN